MGTRTTILAALVLLAFPIPFAASQDAGTVRVTDETGDVAIHTQTQGVQPAGGYEDMDLEEAWIGEETAVNVTMGFTIVDWQTPTREPREVYSSPDYELHFRIKDAAYRVHYWDYAPCDDVGARFETRHVADPSWHYIACIPTTVDKTAGTLKITLPKELLLDSNNTQPRVGDQLEDFVAFTADNYLWGTAGDRVPDEGFADPFILRLGQSGLSPLQLSSPSRVRFSNGASTSLLFPVDVENRASTPVTLSLVAADVPSGWEISVPATVVVAAQATKRVPVIAAIPFQHEHGLVEEFRINAASLEDAQLGANLTLGVYFPEIPQPAGHHNTMWLHSRVADFTNARDFIAISGYELWFNPLEEDPDPDAEDTHVGYQAQEPEGDRVEFVWNFPLKPALRMGLDFDPLGKIVLTTAVESGLPEADADVTATLWYCAPNLREGTDAGLHGCARGSWHQLASGTSAIGALTPNTPKNFEVTLDLTPAADLIDHVEGANLRLETRLSLPQGTGNADMRGVLLYTDRSQFTMPLYEYHDPIDQVFEDLGPLKLIPTNDTHEKEANPGKTSGFPFRLQNDGDRPLRVRLDVEGLNHEWATWQPRSEIELAPGQRVDVRLAVEIPFEAAAGERAELFAIARATEQDGLVAVSRVRVTVTDTVDIADEKDAIVAEADQPGPPVAALFVAALGAVMIRRRRFSSP